MPTYEYACKKCGHRMEAFQKFSDEPLSECPECHEEGALKRLISGGAGFVFKGHGFHSTDYRDNCSTGTCPVSKSSPPCCAGGTCPSQD